MAPRPAVAILMGSDSDLPVMAECVRVLESYGIAYDIRDAIRPVVDAGSFLEVHEEFAGNIVVGFARLAGRSVDVFSAAPEAAQSAAGAATAKDAGAPQQGVDYSGTNVQEVGVDEPDVVKTDGDLVLRLRDD